MEPASTPIAQAQNSPQENPPFGATELRLNGRQWLVVAGICLLTLVLTPEWWKRAERFSPGPDYRTPYSLSDDYWLYRRRLERMDSSAVPVVGDSVVWGEYVRPDGTLSHFMNVATRGTTRFENCGVNGLFPLSMEGLLASYGASLAGHRVVLHCNILWMSSPKADLSTDKEETFNHSALVPQFYPRIPCYRADANTRLADTLARNIPFCGLVGHIDSAYFDQRGIPQWTLEQNDADPPQTPNIWKNPLAQIRMNVPAEPAIDPLRGTSSPRHRPWTASGATPSRFEWVPLAQSLQWRAFQRSVNLLRLRRVDLFVVIGPFNTHMVAADQLPIVRNMTDQIARWLQSEHIAFAAPRVLPTDLYADASHPLTAGYRLLAGQMLETPSFQKWLQRRR